MSNPPLAVWGGKLNRKLQYQVPCKSPSVTAAHVRDGKLSVCARALVAGHFGSCVVLRVLDIGGDGVLESGAHLGCTYSANCWVCFGGP